MCLNTKLVDVAGGVNTKLVGVAGGVNTKLVDVAGGVNTKLVGVAGYTDGPTNRHIYTYTRHYVAVYNLSDANLIILYDYHPCV